MKQAALKNFDLTWVPISGLVIFVVCFAAYTYWTYKKSNKDFYEKAAFMPLENNDERI
jgi:cbb3-type cytochrome oxidase subunit 3